MVGIGSRIRAAKNRWIRKGQLGRVVGFDQEKGRWLVRFDRPYPGGGLGGAELYLDEADFTAFSEDLPGVEGAGGAEARAGGGGKTPS